MRAAIEHGIDVMTPEGLEILRKLPAVADTAHEFEVGSYVLHAAHPSSVWLAEVTSNEADLIEIATVESGEGWFWKSPGAASYSEEHTDLQWWQSQNEAGGVPNKRGDIFAITEARKAAWLAGETLWQLHDQHLRLHTLVWKLFADGLLTRDRLDELEKVASDPEAMQKSARCEVDLTEARQRAVKLTNIVNILQRMVIRGTGSNLIDLQVPKEW
jgi:hypothetical protein